MRDGPSAQLQPAGFSADPECSQATNSCVGVYTHKIVVKIKKKPSISCTSQGRIAGGMGIRKCGYAVDGETCIFMLKPQGFWL